MPTYHYICKKCGHELEELQSFTEPPLIHCPNCKTDNLTRTVGTGSGLIFKGSGFYQTDYKKERTSRAKGGSPKETKEKPTEKKTEKEKPPTKGERPGSPPAEEK